MLRHIWKSTDRVIMIEGDAGSGKTTGMQIAIPGVSKPGVFLAASATASRGELRDRGFKNADTITQFLINPKFQEQARDGYIYVDEAPLAALTDIDKVIGIAKELNARVIVQGDRKQHTSVQRGSLFHVLERHAGLPVARLTEIHRQKEPKYKEAVAAIAKGNVVGGFDILSNLGWVKETPVFDHNRPLVEDYLSAIQTRKPNGEMTTALIVAPTRAEGAEIVSGLRRELKARGLINADEQTFPSLKPMHWTEAEQGDLANYAGTEVVRFHRNTGPFKAGQHVSAEELAASDWTLKPEHFSIYAPGQIQLAAGDVIRITAGGKDRTGRHKLENGATYTVASFTEAGNIRLANGWILDKKFAHFEHGYVTTSHSSQSSTVDRVMLAMGSESSPAISAEQFYVSVSRGRDRCTIYSDMSPTVLRKAIQKSQPRKSATDLIPGKRPASRWRDRAAAFMRTMRCRYRQLREKAEIVIGGVSPERERSYAR